MKSLALVLCCLVVASVFLAQDVAVTQFGYDDGLTSENVTAVFQDSRGLMWVGTATGGLHMMRSGTLYPRNDLNAILGGSIRGIRERDSGELLIASGNGLFAYDGRECYKADISMTDTSALEWLPADLEQKTIDIIEQSAGHYWLGTADGLYSYNSVDSTSMRIRDRLGLLEDRIQALCYDNDDLLWIGTENRGLLLYHGSASRSVNTSILGEVRSFCMDQPDDKIIALLEGGQLVRYNPLDATSGNVQTDTILTVADVYFDDERGILVSTGEGELGVVEGNSVQIARTLGLGDDVLAIRYSEGGNGLIELRDHTIFELFEQVPGDFRSTRSIEIPAKVPADDPVRWFYTGNNGWLRVGSNSITSIRGARVILKKELSVGVTAAFREPSGVLWLGTSGSGIYRYGENASAQKVQTPIPMEFSPIHILVKSGNVLTIGSSEGVRQLVLDDQQRRVKRISNLYISPGRDLVKASFCARQDGSLAVLDNGAVHIFKLQGYLPSPSKPDVYISNIEIGSTPLDSTKYINTVSAFYNQRITPVFSHSDSDIGFTFSAIQLLSTGPTKYSWKLDPQYAEWSTPAARNSVRFASLPAGHYVFRIRACAETGGCGPEAVWAFTIKKPWWSTWWFVILSGIVLFATLALLFRVREHQLTRRSQREREALLQRIRVLELDRKVSQLQINPHFMANAHQAILNRINAGDTDEAAKMVAQYSILMRMILNASTTDAIAVEDELTFIKTYVDVENIGRNVPVVLSVEYDSGVETFGMEIPPMLLQPLVENSIKYGADQVSIKLSEKDDILQVVITDNGPGLPEHLTEKGGKQLSRGHALDIIKQRLEVYGEKAFIRLNNIHDNGRIQGASVTLQIPLRAAN